MEVLVGPALAVTGQLFGALLEVSDRSEVLLQGDEATRTLWVQIERGTELVRQSSDITGCCITVYCKKCYYTRELDDLDQSLTRFYHIAMEWQRRRETEEMRQTLNDIVGMLNGIHGELLQTLEFASIQ